MPLNQHSEFLPPNRCVLCRQSSPVSPTGDPDGLDDVDRHLEEKDKEEEEETEGAVRPDKGKETKQHKGDINILYMYDNEILELTLKRYV